MRILHVVAGMDPRQGGVCQAIRTIIQGLILAGDHHNEVACLDDPRADYLASESFPVHALGPAKGPWCYGKGLFPWLLENLGRFDSVIVHGLWLYPSHAAAKALRTLKRRGAASLPALHVMPHGMLDPYFQRDPSRRVKAFRNWIYWKVIEHRVVNEATGLLFTCEEERLLARQPFCPYRPKLESVVGLGVEEPPGFRAEMSEAFLHACPDLDGRPYLLFLSRIHPKKGIDLLIRAYAQLATSGIGPSRLKSFPALIIAGPLGSPYATEMQRLAEELVLRRSSISDHYSPRILFPGMLRDDAKWGAFYGCEAFVLPSHQENFGIAVVEALACGKPVLISNQVNIWREIDGRGGMVQPDSLDGIRNLLKDWQSLSVEERQNMSVKAIQCFQENFRIDGAARKLFQTLQ
jgi:glycosyltransferase involved in cell wall biosynthesis